MDISKLLQHRPAVPIMPAGAVLCAITAAFWLFGGLSGLVGLIGLLAGLALLFAWPLENSRPSPPVAPSAPSPQMEIAPDGLAAAHVGAVLNGIPAPALLVTPDGVVSSANAAATDVLGVRIGQALSFAIRSPEIRAAVEKVKAEGKPQTTSMKLSVPVERALSVHVAPAKLEEDDGTSLLLVFQDRTEEMQLSQLRADFVANASHELRTPLASVKGFIETLQGAAKDDPIARDRFLAIMHEQASRMSRLIDDLLSLSRIEMREHVPPRDTVDLASIVRELSAALQPLAASSGRTLQVEIEERPALVRGDRDELVQVIQNLVQNAVKYGRDGGKVHISVKGEGGRIAIAVTDDGIGIAPEHLPRLTERFYRVNAKDSRERGGTGLGLAIVKHIVNRHRGELRITSSLGQGSTFTTLLPRAGT